MSIPDGLPTVPVHSVPRDEAGVVGHPGRVSDPEDRPALGGFVEHEYLQVSQRPCRAVQMVTSARSTASGRPP